jgi:zinc protease
MQRHFLAAALFALTAAPVFAAPADAALTIPPLAYKETRLPNGLQVLSIEDHASPTVAVQVWYHVGSKDDPAQRSGFAHLFEHLMFKSTKNLAAEQFDRLTEDVGGSNNASTGDDVTNYFEVIPSNYLQTLLWAEAERLKNLTVDEPNFKSERAVVEEEFRQRILAPPYGRLEYALQKNSYAVHPYKRPTIGSIEDLEAASLDDVIAFHNTYYRPDNATLIVVGDFEPAQLAQWVDLYFGKISKPDAPIPRVDAIEPPRSEDRRITEQAPNVPLPALGMTWLAPPAKSPDSAALRVAAAILAGGDSSRLHQALVYRQQVAQEVSFEFSDNADVGLITATAVLASGRKLGDAEKAVLAEIQRLQKTPISDAELDKAKTQLLTQALVQRETNEGKAFELGSAVILTGEPANADKALAALQAVTAADVQRVIKEYVSDRHRVTVEYRAAAATGAKK